MYCLCTNNFVTYIKCSKMSEIWNFSPSLAHQVSRCLDAASKNENNKWFRQFGHCKNNVNDNLTYNTSEIISNLNNTSKEISSPITLSDGEECLEDNKHKNLMNSVSSEKENVEKLREYIEMELASRFDYLTEECLKNHNLFLILANTLPVATIEKLCKYIYDNTNINKKFLAIFFKHFLPTYIKKEFSCLTLDLLINGSRIYPTDSDILIKEIIKDLNIPNKLLQDYVATLNETRKTKFLLIVEELNLSADVFVHNLFTINIAYKDCVKTDRIQTLVQLLLYENSEICCTEKQYGRLLLAFLQTEKSMGSSVDFSNFERIVDMHQSPFRRPCLNVLNDLKDKQKHKEEDIESN